MPLNGKDFKWKVKLVRPILVLDPWDLTDLIGRGERALNCGTPVFHHLSSFTSVYNYRTCRESLLGLLNYGILLFFDDLIHQFPGQIGSLLQGLIPEMCISLGHNR